MTKWWKCDLQVATPGEPRFKGKADWNLLTAEGRTAAADDYIAAAVAANLEVLVLADHNSTEWVDEMVAAGQRRGIVVFPGFEVSSATGADGAHLVIFGDSATTGAELNKLLFTSCGFDNDNPTFSPSAPDNPAPSPFTLPQILDKLPEGHLAIAPHAFTDNGIASSKTVQGELRWKALHHDRLGAVDVGNIDFDLAGDSSKASFRERFVRRQLDFLPGLRNLAFVSTSDTYRLEDLGGRFTWIRMEQPTLEAMRQAFLDHGARVACDWDPRFKDSEKTPNDVTHSWVRQVTMTGLTSTTQPLTIEFDPRLTVLIGGRGAGKSTVVAALRHLYGDIEALPEQAQVEARQLESAVFAGAALTSSHVLPYSSEEQTATWTRSSGSQTIRSDGQATPTQFAVRVISQKELFERAATSRDNPYSTSKNLLALVDDALSASGHLAAAGFLTRHDEARTKWVTSARTLQTEKEAVAGRAQLFERVQELTRQVAAFDNEANQARRTANDHVLVESRLIEQSEMGVRNKFDVVAAAVDEQFDGSPASASGESEATSGASRALLTEINAVATDTKAQLEMVITAARVRLDALSADRGKSLWAVAVAEASRDTAAYVSELAALGLDPTAYEAVRESLLLRTSELAELDQRASALPAREAGVDALWSQLLELLRERHDARSVLLDAVADRSQILRFQLRTSTDTTSWVQQVRELLGLRADGFVDDVPDLAKWLWQDAKAESDLRFKKWQQACVSGDFTPLATEAGMRTSWVNRLKSVDPLIRTRLAAEIADETVNMEFLRFGKADSPDASWEALTAGSPGQRSAAMLSFVLHQGNEPLVLDQPEDDLDTEWISELVVQQLRTSRWRRQVIVVTHNANIPVNADAERVVVLENTAGSIQIRTSQESEGATVEHCGALEDSRVRADIQRIMEGGVEAFVHRERRYNNEVSTYRIAMQQSTRT